MDRAGYRAWIVAGLLLGVAAGCGPRIVRYPVTGLVTLDGKPVKQASIAFVPEGQGQPGVATTDDEGRFAVHEVRTRDGMRPGAYQVAVFLAELSPRRGVPAPDRPDRAGETSEEISENRTKIVRYVVPERYGVAATSGLTVDVAGPMTDLTFALTTNP